MMDAFLRIVSKARPNPDWVDPAPGVPWTMRYHIASNEGQVWAATPPGLAYLAEHPGAVRYVLEPHRVVRDTLERNGIAEALDAFNATRTNKATEPTGLVPVPYAPYR